MLQFQAPSIGETQCSALLAIYASPTREIVRATRGWWTTTDPAGRVRSFSSRTVHLLSNAWLVGLHGPCADRAPLTRKGLLWAQQLSDATPSGGAA
jgi:hypothetical protein